MQKARLPGFSFSNLRAAFAPLPHPAYNSGMTSISALQTFRAMDTDTNGGISAQELKQGQLFAPAGLRQAIAKTDAATVFKQFDTDSNGSLSPAELAQGLAQTTPDVASALLAAQQQQNPVSQLLAGLKTSAYNTLPGLTTNAGTLAANVLSAYFKA